MSDFEEILFDKNNSHLIKHASFPLDDSYFPISHSLDYLNLEPGRLREEIIQKENEKEEIFRENELYLTENYSNNESDGFNFDGLDFPYRPPKPKCLLCCHKSIFILN